MDNVNRSKLNQSMTKISNQDVQIKRSKNQPVRLNIFVVGETYVGKTCLARTYETGVFKENTNLRIGVSRHTRRLKIQTVLAELSIWNVMGNDRFKAIRIACLQNEGGALLLYDVTSVSTFQNLSKWLETIREVNPEAIIFIIGARNDLLDQREVSRKAGQKFARSEKVEFFECSAKTGENVEEVFEHMAVRMLQKKGLIPPDETEIEGKSLGWGRTKEIPNISVTDEEIALYASVKEKETFNSSVAEKDLHKSHHQAVLLEADSHLLKDGKFQPELKNFLPLADSDNLPNSTAEGQPRLFQQESVTFESVNSSIEHENSQSRNGGCNASLKRDDSMPSQSCKSSELSESCEPSDDKKEVLSKAEKSVLSEEEMQLEGKCPAWFA